MINAYNYGRIIYDLHLKRSLVSLGNEIKNNALIKETEKDGNMQICCFHQYLLSVLDFFV